MGLWDLSEGKIVTSITQHKEKVSKDCYFAQFQNSLELIALLGMEDIVESSPILYCCFEF